MRNVLINFANGAYKNSQKRNSASGLLSGFDTCHQFAPRDIDLNFREKYKNILNKPRGCGYWLWKPYFIYNQLKACNKNDVIFYADSGSDFIKNIRPLTDRCRDDVNGLISFKLSGKHKERQWTKRDVLKRLNADQPRIVDTDQLMASFIIVRKNEYTLQFMHEYLIHACDENMITDKPSVSPNYPEFRDHRHDQSIFSVMCKQQGVTQMDDPTQWGQKHKQFPISSQYIWHRRNNNHIKTEPRNLEGNKIDVIPG